MTDVLDERDELTRLTEAAETLAHVVEIETLDLRDDAKFVVERLKQRRFDVAVVGEFNRGKSTLLNRLVERTVLPAGVLPVTSVITELTYGPREVARIHYEDGSNQVIDLKELEKYVTEQANPGNRYKVASASISIPSTLLETGAILIDTPGVGSIFRHNSASAKEAILRADGAIMVMSADTPITEAERNLIKLLSRRSEKTFFVLNRIDHLDESDLENVTWFVENVLAQAFDKPQHVYRLSAKHGTGFDDFAKAFQEFIDQGLDDARLILARRDLATLADRIDNECSLEESALAMNSTQLEERLGQFRRAADWQHDSFTDDRILFSHAVERITSELVHRLEVAHAPDETSLKRIREATLDVPRSEIEMALDKAIENEIRTTIEPLRRHEEFESERAWRKAAERFERATHRRADKLRDLAGELFEVELRPIALAQPASQRGRFFYSAPVRVAAPAGVLTRLLRPLLPERRNRQRLIEAGEQRLRDERKRHIDRLGDDLIQRLTEANQAIAIQMEEQVTQVAQAMVRTIERVQSQRSDAEQNYRSNKERTRRLKDAANSARDVARMSDA